MQNAIILIRQLLAFLILVSLSTTLAVAQKKPAAPAKAATCSGAWTGNITYSKTISTATSKTEDRVSARGKDKKKWEMKYRYKASVAVLESPERNGQNIGKASIQHSFSSVDTTAAEERNSCDQGKTWRVMKGDFETKTETRGLASNQPAMAYVAVNSDGTYSVGVSIPQIQGITSGSEKSSFSNQCTKKEGKSITHPDTPTTVEGNKMNSSGHDRVDPKDPNNLSGSWTQSLGDMTETITWSLKKCGAPLRITDLQFEDMKFPNWNDWKEINEQTGTTDGNFVKIKAKFLNESGETKYADLRFKETYKGDKWDGARPDAPLEDTLRSVRVEPYSEETVEMILDSEGYAWFDDGRPRLVQRIKAELEENGKKIDERVENLKVNPKPIVFVGGIWTNTQDFELYQNLLTTTHSYGWKTYRTIDVSNQGTIAGEGQTAVVKANKTVYDNADNLEKYVKLMQGENNAWHIDMLAHSTGGLVARLYIHKQMPALDDGRPLVKHLMMMGTPNLGVPCADSMANSDAFKNNMQTAKELMPDEIAIFNKFVTNRKNTRFSALVGDSVPLLCATPTWNDGFVSVESAKFGIPDFAITKSMHPNMINAKTFNNFVKPHVVTGPKGTYPLPVVSEQ